MGQSLIVLLRGFVLLTFLVVMPLLAVPAVGKWYDAWLLGELKPGATVVEAHRPSDEAAEPTVLVNGVSDVSPAAMLDSASETASPSLPASSSPALGAATVSSGDQFEAIPKRLQELGAEYLKLESVAEEDLQYRFRCTVPLPGSETYGRQFHATAADPVEAMRHVLAQVESWQAARDNLPKTRDAVQRR